ncbi:Thioredoxin [Paraconexibacter sp. AEG42_29]|uniref:Thioredoxin n=1 Tax=Paraconexibacter sp. AEG42_29 TaxID=2997339 RepID=A0AAU7B0H1_9ACTN
MTQLSTLVVPVTDDAFTAVVLESDRPVVVDFWAPWCGPCRVMAPVFEELAGSLPHVLFAKVDIDAEQVTAARYGVLAAPTLIVFRAGQPVLTLVGSRPRRRLERELEAVLSAAR